MKSFKQFIASRRALGKVAARIGAVSLWFVVWLLIARVINNELILVSPFVALERLSQIVCSAVFIQAVGCSFARIAFGFSAGFVAAFVVGIAAASSGVCKTILEPAVSALKSTPIVCIIVLLLMWVGSKSVSVLAVFLVVFPAIYLAVLQGVESSSDSLRRLLTVFGVTPTCQFLADGYQQVLPYMLAASKHACGMAWKAGVAAELIGTPAGSMGSFIYQAKLLFEVSDVCAWTIAVVALSWLSEKCFVWLLTQSGLWALKRSFPRSVISSVGAHTSVQPSVSTNIRELVRFCDATLGHDLQYTATAFNFVLNRGERVVICDGSGAGKTTLINTIAGLIPLIKGQRSIAPQTTFSLMGQQTVLVEALSAVQNIQLVCGAYRSESEIRAALRELLIQDEPEAIVDVPVCQLSGGQRRRVELARALLHDSQVVLLDEPFSSLDAKTHKRAAQFVLEHLNGRALLVASHDTKEAQLLDATAHKLFT